LSLQFEQVATAGTPSTLTGIGNYTVPANTSLLSVFGVGAGGAGANMSTAGVGGGGGGGESAIEPAYITSPGATIPYGAGVGASSGSGAPGGATIFGGDVAGQAAVIANGGQSALTNSINGGAGGTGSTNSEHFNGGAGRTASGSVGGGGGSSGGSASPGQTPMGTSNVVFTSSGAGTWLCPAGVFQISLFEIAGGGGGAAAGGGAYGAGGGGGGESAAQLVAVTPGHTYNFVIGAGGAGGAGGGSGNPGIAGSSTAFTGDSVTVTAHGGAGGQVNTNFFAGGTGGAGGSGSTATTHFDGGAGATGKPYGGGGGSSAGSSSPGNAGSGFGSGGVAVTGGGAGGAGTSGSGAGHSASAPGGGGGASYNEGSAGGSGATGTIVISYPGGAPTNNGAAAVPGGGAGGAGGGSNNTAGSAGSVPGGGGGGADSTGTAEAGGAGGNGHIVVTPFAPPGFKTLIVHRPGPDAPASLNPYVNLGNGSSVPNGSTEFAVASLVTGVNPRFGGTYTLMAVNFTWSNPTASRTIFATVKQYEYAGGPAYSISTLPITITPSTLPGTGQLVVLGNLTLPYKDIAPDNQGSFPTVTITDSNTSDRFLDMMFLDTLGQTFVVNEATGYTDYYIDEPTSDRALPRVLGSNNGRPDAISVSDFSTMSGGPITVDPGTNMMLVYCVEGVPNVAGSYFARWYLDRLS
jgi:hypothetical protein